MRKWSLVVCKIIDHSSEDVIVGLFGRWVKSEVSNDKLLHSVWCNVSMRISSGHCVLRITKFDEKISLALREKKKKKKARQNFHTRWNFFKNCLPGIMHLYELNKLQKAESIHISSISTELELFGSFEFIFQSTATAFVYLLLNYCIAFINTRHPLLWIAGYTLPDFDASKSNL